jgi:hypothetical protein
MTMTEIQSMLQICEKITELYNVLHGLQIEQLKAEDKIENLSGYAKAGAKSDLIVIDLGIADLEAKIADLRSKLITFKKINNEL